MLSVWLSFRLSVTLCIVAKLYILQQNCLKKWMESAYLGTRRYNLHRLSLKLPKPQISKLYDRLSQQQSGFLSLPTEPLAWLPDNEFITESNFACILLDKHHYRLQWKQPIYSRKHVVANCHSDTLLLSGDSFRRWLKKTAVFHIDTKLLTQFSFMSIVV